MEALCTAVAKEKSNVNLLRHQLDKKLSIATDNKYVLLKIVKHLPMYNRNQFFKCSLISDNTNLLCDLSSNNSLITVMNVPGISSLVNISEKPILKVYKPIIILDFNQSLIHITRFTALSSNNVENLNVDFNKKDLKVINEYYCPCIDEKVISLKCESKFNENSNCIINMLF